MNEIAKQIRRGFRTLMNGPVSESMREKGADYHINWGISLPHLMEMAKEYQPDLHLALELWKDNVRESKLMALMLMPHEEFTADIAMLWSEQLQTQEIAELASMLLYQHANYAPQLSFHLLAAGNSLQQILALNTLSRLFTRGMLPNERGLQELQDQIECILQSDDLSLRHAASNCLLKLEAN